jgi:hypothetical protein
MDVRGVLRPVGPLPPRVYWLRRLLPFLAVVLLVTIVALSCSGSDAPTKRAGSVTPIPTTAQTPSAGTSATPTPTPTPAATPSTVTTPAACQPADLGVVASTDARSYPRGTTPILRVTIRNASSSACVLTHSPSRRNWTIRSGSDLIWTTVGCAKSTAALETTLAPAASIVRSVAWNRHRIGPNCTASRALARPGTYQLVVVVDGVRSAPVVFTLSR